MDGISFILGVWAATSYHKKGWKGFFKYFFLPLFLIIVLAELTILYSK